MNFREYLEELNESNKKYASSVLSFIEGFDKNSKWDGIEHFSYRGTYTWKFLNYTLEKSVFIRGSLIKLMKDGKSLIEFVDNKLLGIEDIKMDGTPGDVRKALTMLMQASSSKTK